MTSCSNVRVLPWQCVAGESVATAAAPPDPEPATPLQLPAAPSPSTDARLGEKHLSNQRSAMDMQFTNIALPY